MARQASIPVSFRLTSRSTRVRNSSKPDWMPPFVGLVRGQLDRAKAIDNNLFGLQQFVIGKPIWETYLKGEEPDPKVAMQKVKDAVQAEIKKG